MIIPLEQPYVDLPGNKYTHLGDAGTDGEEMANRNSRPGIAGADDTASMDSDYH